MNRKTNILSRSFHQACAGSNTICGEITAEFNAIGCAALRRHGEVDRLHTNFKRKMIPHF
jgi:hypothetical protein